MKKTIAIDLSGGDKEEKVSLPAVYDFLDQFPNWKVIGFTNKNNLFSKHNNFEIIQVKTRITQDDKPLAIKRKKDNTLVRAMELVKEDKADAIVSAANSGALVFAAYTIFSPIKENVKPGFAPFATKADGQLFTMLDVGANLDSDPIALEKNALMGQELIKALGFHKKPRVKLLNVGLEPEKGNALLKETYKLLEKNNKINFKGNIEGNKILIDKESEVIVTSALEGNIALKTIEGSIMVFVQMLKNNAEKSLLSKIGLGLAKSFRDDFKNNILNEEYLGGAIVVGLDKLVTKAHGGSNVKMLSNALRTTKILLENDVIKKFEEVLK